MRAIMTAQSYSVLSPVTLNYPFSPCKIVNTSFHERTTSIVLRTLGSWMNEDAVLHPGGRFPVRIYVKLSMILWEILQINLKT